MFDLSLLKAPSETPVIRLLLRLSTRNLGISSKGEPCTAQIRLLSICRKENGPVRGDAAA